MRRRFPCLSPLFILRTGGRALGLFALLCGTALAGVCDTTWDGDKITSAIAGRPNHLRVPLRDQQQRINEVTVGQVAAFSEAKDKMSRLAGLNPKFVICDSAAPNAFAMKTSNGDVVGVTIGMMRLVDGDRDMAAAVIGHEVAHHTHNHGEAGAARDQLLGIAGLLLGLAVDARSARRTGVASNVGQTMGAVGSTLLARKFGRDQEREADATGFQYMVTAEYDPRGAIRLAERMKQLGGGAGLFFDSHPGWEERNELFRNMIASNAGAQQLVARYSAAPARAPAEAPRQDAPAATTAVAYAESVPEAQRAFNAGIAAWRLKDQATAVREFRSAADAGHAQAQAVLGYFHMRGLGGVQQDDGEAVRLFQLSAAQGNAIGQVNLGIAHVGGRGGLAKDAQEAVRLFRAAADQGNALGQANLGYAYAVGLGGLQADEAEAVRLYRLSADQNEALGQSNLGFMYMNGRGGLARDDAEAARLFRLAADKGNANAQAGLGLMYASGRGGITKSDADALRLFRLSASGGSALGQAAMGFAYASGSGGLAKDESEAVRWFRLSSAQGNAAAKRELQKRGLSE